MALSDLDRNLLKRCLARGPRAWEDFVDRFLGLVVHVINHSAHARSIPLSEQDREDLVSEVFLAIVEDDFAVLRRFRGESSLATYLTVVARRVVVRELLQRRGTPAMQTVAAEASRDGRTDSAGAHRGDGAASSGPEERISSREEVERLLGSLDGQEAEIVRMYHLEGRSYREISSRVGMPENSIGPTLSRARAKLRAAGQAGSRS
ncbi:MAG: RNA polymerase sigma factor [Pirellulaceae bacterium]